MAIDVYLQSQLSSVSGAIEFFYTHEGGFWGASPDEAASYCAGSVAPWAPLVKAESNVSYSCASLTAFCSDFCSSVAGVSPALPVPPPSFCC